MRSLVLLTAALGILATATFVIADDVTGEYTIQQIMKKCMKDDQEVADDGLCKRVATGQADAVEQELLVEMLTALTQQEPPKGEAASWQEKTSALLIAAQAVVAGEEGAGVRLAQAANCKECHSAHRVK